MVVIETRSFKQTKKKLTKYKKELDNLNKIIFLLVRSKSLQELLLNNESKLYGFEKLKYYNNDIYSFNLSRNKGVIRLLVNEKDNICYLLYISFKHYKDFNLKKVIYNDN